jgi:succinoglycan biosynthesis transport protein ExoP
MDFIRLLQLVGRHKWLILAVITVATTGTWFGVRLKGAAYRATSTLMPQQQALQTLDGVAALSASLGERDMERASVQVRKSRIESLMALMLSPRVLGQLIAKLNLAATPADLQRMIQVNQVTSEVIQVRATAPTPQLASDLVNGLASTFVEFYGDLSTRAIAESTKLLNEQEAAARREVEACKVAVQKYKASRRISSLSDQLNGTLGRLNAVRQAREGTAAQLAEVEAQLRETEAQLARTPEMIRVVEKSNDSPALQQLRNEVGALEKDLALERGTRTESHPRVVELKGKLASAQALLRREEGRLVERVRHTPNPDHTALGQRRNDLRAQRDGLVAKVASLETSMGALDREMNAYAGADVQLSTLMQRYTTAEQRYANVVTRLRQAEANADSIRRSSAIAIVDTSGPLNPPVDVSLGTAIKLTVAAFGLSLALCIFLLAAWTYLDRTVKTSADAEALVEMPVAAIIPRALPRAQSTPLRQLAALMPASPEGEAYRFLGLHLLLMRPDNPLRVLMMATAKPGQGATTTIANLAAILAQGNRRVILVDADLRRPSLHEIFDVGNDKGLTSVLAEGAAVSEALQQTLLPNLKLLAGGPIVDNPWVLLRSAEMESLVRDLREMADFVLIDTPSAAAFADAFNVAPLADGIFMVVRARYQPTGIELKIKRMFEESGARVLGAVLNDVPMQNVDSCRYHAHYYGSPGRGGGGLKRLGRSATDLGANGSAPPALPAAEAGGRDARR